MMKFSNGVSPMVGGPATKQFLFGTRVFQNVAGGMTRVKSSLSRRAKLASAIAMTSKPGWICMMPRKEENQLSPKTRRTIRHEIALDLLANYSAIQLCFRS